MAAITKEYDPFAAGPLPVRSRTIEMLDAKRGKRAFPCETWCPNARSEGPFPLIVFSHSSGGDRQQSTFLTTHLASHGYVVAALNHSELVARELARKDSESPEQAAARVEAWIANRVPDISFLIDSMLSDAVDESALIDRARIGIIGHSFGGWTALASPETEARISAIVALVPAGNSKPLPGVIPATLTFAWRREVPTLYLAAELDVATPVSGICELFERTPSAKQMLILSRADHAHFMDNAEQLHEGFRLSSATGDAEAMIRNMKPFSELCPAETAHSFTRSLAVAHMDATLKQREDARRMLSGDLPGLLVSRGIHATEHRPV